MTTVDPALRFWLDYTEREGAVHETDGDGGALVLLPDHLQATLELPETVVVTIDPGVAREDGASLLIPGYGPLDRAAARVLDAGDVGWSMLAWPTSEPPTPAALLDSARELLPVDHGRIDLGGEPTPRRWTVLRVGALVTYAVSLDHRFCEREEVWVDGRRGASVPAAIADCLARGPVEALDSIPPATSDLLDGAIAGAHLRLRARADRRLDTLRSDAEGDCEAELARVDSYYRATLASIEQRRSSAAPERRSQLDAQAAATRLERSRRVAEVREKFTPSFEIRPFRLHAVLVPSLVVPVDVRRGSRRYPLELTWVLPARTWAPVSCPSCEAAAALVAGRERLGCRTCLASRAEPHPPPVRLAPEPAPANAPRDAAPNATATSPPEPRPAGGRRPGGGPRRPMPRPASRRRPTRRTATAGPNGRHLPSIDRIGSNLAFDLWSAVAHRERWPRKGKGIAPQSPYETLHRLYGPGGPAVVLGFPLGGGPTDVTTAGASATDPTSGLNATTGLVNAPDGDRSYTLRWYLDGAKPVVAEVLPFAWALGHRLDPRRALVPTAGRAGEPQPAPRVDLDEVAAAAWRLALDTAGLPLAIRALTAWWRLDADEWADYDPDVVAAAVVRLVAVKAGVRVVRSNGTDDQPALAGTARRLQRRLRLSAARAW